MRKSKEFLKHIGHSIAVDPSLIGIWEYTSFGRTFRMEIEADGTWHVLDEVQFEISTDGQTLKAPLTQPEVFQRIYGSGVQIPGVWKRDFPSDDLIEEIYYRANGRYVASWTDSSGVFLDEFIGSYEVNGSTLSTKELKGIVTTNSNQLELDIVFGPTPSGAYSVAADGNSWTWTIGASTVYTRV